MPITLSHSAKPPYFVMSLFMSIFLSLPVSASRLAAGMQFESWKSVDLEVSKNPAHKDQMDSKLGYNHIKFDVDGLVNYYIEEPGFLMSLIAGAANNEAAEVNARNEAIRKGEHTYKWNYTQPPAVPEGRWFRWGYTHGFASGGTRTYPGRALSNGKDTVYSLKDPDLRLDYIRFDANMVTAPRLIGGSDFYWMIGSDFSGTSVKIYGKNINPGDDWSFATVPLNLHLGWQPAFFPYLMVEANGGIDIFDPIANLFVGFTNYTPYSEFGMRASLGTDWLSCYYDISHQVDPLWDFDKYNRRYSGIWSVMGIRLDLGNLIAKLF